MISAPVCPTITFLIKISIADFHNNEKLDHIPSSYIVLMVHVVKGRQYTHRRRGLNRMQRWSLRPTLDFEFRCFNHRQHGTASELQIGRGMMRAINSARLALFIHRITSAKRTREVRPALLVGESSTQLLMYSLGMYVS